MAKKLKIRNAILCEYAAMGSNNKHNLVNVFSGDVIVGKFPADIPIGLYIEVERESLEEPPLDLQVEVAGERILHGKLSLSGNHLTGAVVVRHILIHVEKDTKIEVILTSEGYARTVAISKKIYQGKLPGQPSA